MERKSINIAAFDVDGTLTFTDSFMLFLRYVAGREIFILNLILLLPVFILYSLRLMSRDTAKNKILTIFFKGMKHQTYLEKCQKFAKCYDLILRGDGINAVNIHKNSGDLPIIVSASLEDYLVPLAQKLGINQVIATKLEVINGVLSGKMYGQNCRAQEKLNRIRNLYGNAPIIAAYGDSAGDKQMLEAAITPYYRRLIDEPRNAKSIKFQLYFGHALESICGSSSRNAI